MKLKDRFENGLRTPAQAVVFAWSIFALSTLLPGARAATPAAGNLGSRPGSIVQWNGSAAAATNGESTCVDGTNCDVYALTLEGPTSSYKNEYVTIKLTWKLIADEYDLYVHQGGLTGPVISSAQVGPLVGSQTVTFSPGTLGSGLYIVHIVASAVSPGDPYAGVASVGTTPPPPGR